MTLTRRYRKNLKGGKRRKRKTIRRKRKAKKRTRRRKMKGGAKMRLTRMNRKLSALKRKIRRRQRGGCGGPTYKCNYPSNVGEIFTGIPLNKNPFLPDPKYGNSNIRSRQKGGGLMDDIGLGDVLLNYYKGTNAISNQPIRYKGGKPLMKADPMYQPNLSAPVAAKITPNVPQFYNVSSQSAATNTIN